MSAPTKADASAPEVSVVVPVYRNRRTLGDLLDRLDAALAGERREYVFVIDGSPDDSAQFLREEQARRPWIVVVELARNFGQHAALSAGFEHARGDVALILDADLQQAPEDLPRFVESWRAGHDFVSGWRVRRKDSLGRRFGSWGLNRLVAHFVRQPLHDWGCPIAAIDRSIYARLSECGEKRRFLKPLVASLARSTCEVEVEGLAREQGKSSYSYLALIGLALDFAVSFSRTPFQRLAGLGVILFSTGMFGGALYFVLRLLGMRDSPPFQGAVIIAVFFGLQVLILGALGEFTHRTYHIVQGQPLYIVGSIARGPVETGSDRDEA